MAEKTKDTKKQSAPTPVVESPWSRPAREVLGELDVSRESGLDDAEVEQRRAHYGPNSLRESRRRNAWLIWVEQFKSIIVALLAVAAVVAFAFGEYIEGAAIIVVLLINAAIGFVMELRAVRSMEALRKMGRVETAVRRSGGVEQVSAENLVPGDIVIIESGDVVTADLRLVESSKLQANESALTGESAPVGKGVDAVEADAPLAERASMLYKGTAVTRGSGEGVVVGTGMQTELGTISSLVEEVESEQAPVQERLNVLGRKLVWITLIIAAAVAVVGILSGKDPFLIIETAIALAVAAVPEGLPIVATIALARGMRRMAKRNALVNQLSAVETLGSTNIILTDKTGTLTENRMSVVEYALSDGDVKVEGRGLELEGDFQRDGERIDPRKHEGLRQTLVVGMLCGNANLRVPEDESEEIESVGEPMEVALLVAGRKAGFERDALLDEYPEVREEAFDPDVKMMATFHEKENGYFVAVKGAPESVLDACTRIHSNEEARNLKNGEREDWKERNDKMAEDGLRVLAAATRQAESAEEDPYRDLTFLGLIGLLDPPRKAVRDAIAACHSAGVRIVMVTGDQGSTARNVARAVGLVEEDGKEVLALSGREIRGPDEAQPDEKERLIGTDIFYRSSPEQKLDLIDLHQNEGLIVAMIGDGVNDAPALKKADIGVAMGRRGTQVAREASDMVLRDDEFSTIVEAIRQGRIIFDNIRKFVMYLLSCNVSEIMVVGLASMIPAGIPLPILPLQILFLNLVTDVFPALALGACEGEPRIMEQPPRDPDEPVLTRGHWWGIAGYGAVITVCVLGALGIALFGLNFASERAVTVSFLTLAFVQLWHVFNVRNVRAHWWRNEVVQNRWVWGALVLCTLLLIAAVYVPGFSTVMETVDPGFSGWSIVIGMSLIPLAVGQGIKIARYSSRK